MPRQFRHGKGTHFELDDANGDLVDLSDALLSVEHTETVDVAETSAFGSSAKTYVPGMLDGKLSAKGMFDATMDAQLAAVFGQETLLAFVYGPEGSTQGQVKYVGECILTSYKKAGTTGAMVSADLEFQISGRTPPDVFA